MNDFKPKSKAILKELSSDRVDVQPFIPVPEHEEEHQSEDQSTFHEKQRPTKHHHSEKVIRLPVRYMLVGETFTAILDQQV